MLDEERKLNKGPEGKKSSARCSRRTSKKILGVLSEDPEEKLNLLKGKPYEPKYSFEKEGLLEMDIDEIRRRVQLADELDGYGVKVDFNDFVGLSEIEWTEELQRKLDFLKGKSYVPTNLLEVEDINKMNIKKVKVKYGKIS